MHCVRLNSFFVLINSVPRGLIVSRRGLRKGDPLFPYLFLLCTKGLVTILKEAMLNKSLMGIRVCRRALAINYLLFTDDSLIFCKVALEASIHLLRIFNEYGQVLDHCINNEKKTMVFSHNVKEDVRIKISSIWGGSVTKQYEKYLSLPPSLVGQKRTPSLKLKLKCGITSKLGSVNFYLRGKIILIKVVALVIPLFAMSCFKIPKTLCSEL